MQDPSYELLIRPNSKILTQPIHFFLSCLPLPASFSWKRAKLNHSIKKTLLQLALLKCLQVEKITKLMEKKIDNL